MGAALGMAFLDSQRERLQAMLEDVSQLNKTMTGRLADNPPSGDLLEEASREHDRHITLALAVGSKSNRHQIEAALYRIKVGRYGFCNQCEERISVMRLKALPAATLCARCQTDEEERRA